MLSIMLSITMILFRSTVATNNCSQKITQQLQQWIHGAQLALSAFPPPDVTSLSSDYDEPQSSIPAEPIESDQVPRGSRCPTTIQDTLQGIRVIPPKRGNLYSTMENTINTSRSIRNERTEVSGGQTGSGILLQRQRHEREHERFDVDGTGALSAVDRRERANLSADVVMIEQQDNVMQNEGTTRRETGDMDVLEVSMEGAGAMRDGLCSTREVGDALLRQMSDEGEIGGSFDDDARDVLVNGSVDLGEERSDVVVGGVLLDAYDRDRGESGLEKGVITNDGMDYMKNFVVYGLSMIGIIGIIGIIGQIIVICCTVKISSDEQKNGVNGVNGNGNGKDIEQEREDIV